MELSVSLPALSPRSRPFRRVLRRDESGAALVEFALVAVLFFFILYALVVFGMALALKQSVTNAATEGARSAVGISDNTAAADKARTTVQQRLSWLTPSQLAALVIEPTILDPCPATGSGKCIRVKVTYPYQGNELVPPAPIINSIAPRSVGSTAVVQISS
jgi:Flp pilus assembly protein TadG